MEIRKGKLLQFGGSWSSGLGYLLIEDSETGAVEQVPCENAPTVRALEACFGNVITPGHTAGGNGYKDQEVYWSYDEMGFILRGFTPVEDVSPELIKAFDLERIES